MDSKLGFKERKVDIQSMLMAFKVVEYGKPKGADLFKRIDFVTDYVLGQSKQELWLYNRRMLTGPDAEILGMDETNNIIYGINFASADYLGLAQNQYAKEMAIEAAKEFGVNSAGSPLAFGATKYYMQLKEQLKEYWKCKEVLIYSAGWLAGFGVIKGLIRKWDHIIMDKLAHNCLQEGSNAATPNVNKFTHLDYDEMLEHLKRIRAEDQENAILVVTEGLFSMDSDSPDLNAYQQACLQYGAFLLIDCAHDFGNMGEGGRGVWELQNLKDRSNVIMIGTGSKCLSTNIGFVGCNYPNVIQYLKYFSTAYMFTNAINPVQAATSLSNLRILRSGLGDLKRKQVLENYDYLRSELEKRGHKIFGQRCPILPLYVGNEVVCRLVSRIMMDNGVHVNGIEFPVVSQGTARLRVNLMPQHTKEHLDTFVRVFEKAFVESTAIFEKGIKEYQEKQKQLKPSL